MMRLYYNRRLYRSRRDRVIAGVCSGIAGYFGVDAVFVRLLFLLLAFGVSWGPAVVFYFVLVLVIPEESPARPQPDDLEKDLWRHPTEWFSVPVRVIGAIMITLGLVGLLNQPLSSWRLDWRFLWPVVFLGAGLFLMMHRRRPPAAKEYSDSEPIDL